MPNVTDILTLKQQLEGAESGRHTQYDELLDASHGNYYDRVVQSTWQKWLGIVYKKDKRSDGRRQVNVIVNLLPQVIEAKRALWAVTPQVTVPYRSLADEDVALSNRLETVYRHLWNKCRITEKLGDAGWHASLLGTAVFCVYPDFKAHRPIIVSRSPYGFYGVPGNIEQDGTVWKKVLFVTKMRGRQAMAMYGLDGLSDDNLVSVIEYWDEEMKCTIVEEANKIVEGPIGNKLGFVPVITVPNISQPGQWWGKGDGDDAVVPISELNKRFNVENQAFSDQAGAPWEAISPDMPLEDITLDPDGINKFSAGGGMKKSQTGGLPWQLYQSNQQLRQYIDAVTDLPAVMKSMWDGNNVSGKAVTNLQGPVEMRMQLRHGYLHPRLAILNQYAMQMWDAYWGGETTVIRGSIKGKRYNLELRINDFEGYFENDVYVDSTAFFDVQSRVVIGIQMLAVNGLSIKTFVEKLNPFTDDYTAEHEQILAEQREKLQLQMLAIQMQNSGLSAVPDVGKPGQDQMGLEQGFQTTATPLAPPPGVTEEMLNTQGVVTPPQANESMLTGAMGMGGALTPLEGESMSLLTQVADAIRSLTTLRGRVFLSGSILEGAMGPEGIEIWFTDMVDWATVRQGVTKLVPETKGQFNPQQGVPAVPFLEVTPGTSGYEPQEPAALAEENMPIGPEMLGGAPPQLGM